MNQINTYANSSNLDDLELELTQQIKSQKIYGATIDKTQRDYLDPNTDAAMLGQQAVFM